MCWPKVNSIYMLKLSPDNDIIIDVCCEETHNIRVQTRLGLTNTAVCILQGVEIFLLFCDSGVAAIISLFSLQWQ